MSTSPHKNWKGCAMCKPWKRRGQGGDAKEAFRVIKQIGRKRRFGRSGRAVDEDS